MSSTTDAFATAAQLVAVASFGYSSLAKLRHPRQFLKVIEDYRVLPTVRILAIFVAGFVIGGEFVVAMSLLGGWFVLPAGVFALVLLSLFGVAIWINLHRGRRVSCGCFGEASEEISSKSLLRLAFLAIVIAGLELVGTSRLSLSALERGTVPQFLTIVNVGAFTAFLSLTGTWLIMIPDARQLFRPKAA